MLKSWRTAKSCMPGNSLPEFAQLSFPPSLPHFKFLETIKNEGFFLLKLRVFETRTFWQNKTDSKRHKSVPRELRGECLLVSFRPKTSPMLLPKPVSGRRDDVLWGFHGLMHHGVRNMAGEIHSIHKKEDVEQLKYSSSETAREPWQNLNIWVLANYLIHLFILLETVPI